METILKCMYLSGFLCFSTLKCCKFFLKKLYYMWRTFCHVDKKFQTLFMLWHRHIQTILIVSSLFCYLWRGNVVFF